MNKVQKFARLAVISAAAAASAVHAEVPAAVTTEIANAKTDMLTATGAVIAAMVVVWGLRKLGSKMGWL